MEARVSNSRESLYYYHEIILVLNIWLVLMFPPLFQTVPQVRQCDNANQPLDTGIGEDSRKDASLVGSEARPGRCRPAHQLAGPATGRIRSARVRGTTWTTYFGSEWLVAGSAPKARELPVTCADFAKSLYTCSPKARYK